MNDRVLPWVLRAIKALDLRRADRLLLVMPGSTAVAKAAAVICGDRGSLTVLEPRRTAAEAIAEALPTAGVVALEPNGEESFGSFDGVFAAPLTGPLPAASDWGLIVRSNLRPGGRFVIDLPGPTMMPDLLAAAENARIDELERVRQWLSGPDDETLVRSMQDASLRRVETLLGTHVLAVDSPFELVDMMQPWLRLQPEQRLQLGDALARQLRSTSQAETLVRRTCVAGMR
jgi:hypothetical protein